MSLTLKQAEELVESLADVFTPDGHCGVIDRIDGDRANVVGRLVNDWFPISQLDSAETLKGGK